MPGIKKERRGGRPREKSLTTWGAKIEQLMENRGLSRQQLADELGVSYVSVLHLTTGDNGPSQKTFEKLADVLGVSLDDIRRS
jgi:transcriptional regulator with XRE-family HTH domain